MSPRGLAAESLIDVQVATELALRALRMRDVEKAIRCMQLARTAARIAAGKVEGIDAR